MNWEVLASLMYVHVSHFSLYPMRICLNKNWEEFGFPHEYSYFSFQSVTNEDVTQEELVGA